MTKREIEQRHRRVRKAVLLMAEIEGIERKARAFVKEQLGTLTAADRECANEVGEDLSQRLWQLCNVRFKAQFK